MRPRPRARPATRRPGYEHTVGRGLATYGGPGVVPFLASVDQTTIATRAGAGSSS